MYQNEKLIEFNGYLRNRKVAIVGLGVSNLPLLDYLYNIGARITVFDKRNVEEFSRQIMEKITTYHIEYYFGGDYLSYLKGFDMIFRSPSILPTTPELAKEKERGAIVTTEIEMFMEICPCKMIGVTGSDGKTTTTTLIYHILQEGGYHCFCGGNIGTPLFTKLPEVTPEDVVVLELSSFQLMHMLVSPNISVITNITPNHLDIHSSFEEYIEAKKAIFLNQSEQDCLVLNYDNEITRNLAKEAKGKVIFYSGQTKLDNGYIVDDGMIKECKDRLRKHVLNTKDLKIRGKHNFENICAALAATSSLVPIEVAKKAILPFSGVEHRLEFVREINGVKWYNDSVSSSPTRTMAGLNSFDEEIVLIAGGYDKNLDYTPLAKPIVQKVKSLILVGNTADKIFNAVKEELEKEKKEMPIYVCDDFAQTVAVAHKVAEPGQIVLLSPASASFDMFHNFAERGKVFKQLVNELKEE